MAKRNDIPENDRDLLLAKNIGEALENRSAFEDMEDELVNRLAEYKNHELEKISSYNISDKLWMSIESSVHPQQKSRVIPFYSSSVARWAAAAAILIGAFIGFYWLTLPVSPTLIAQSGSAIEVISLQDGSEITLRPHSELYEVAFNNDMRNYMITGEAFFEVAEDPNRPFSVQAGQTVVTVLGTRFNLSTWNSKPSVYLEEGSISFSADTASVILEPGQSSQFVNGNLTPAVNTDPDQFTDWISDTIIFENTIPEDIVAELSQHFNISITISELEDRTPVSGSLRLDSAGQTLQDLGMVLGGNFRQTAANTYTFVPQN